ncbi:MAG: LacI family DNA-binding transcriptional regulator [Actinomycetota bacterium]
MRKATIYSIAEVCGVSPSTVSRAFSRPELISEPVRERIYAVAEAVDYRPNQLARGLTTGRTATIGVQVADVTNPYFPPLISAVGRAADDRDLAVLLTDVGGRSGRDLLLNLSDRVDGVIVVSPRASDDDLLSAAQRLPAVVVNRPVGGMTSIVCDNTEALQEATQHLVELGHTELAYLRGPGESWASNARGAAIEAQATHSKVNLIDLGPFAASFEGGRNAARAAVETTATAYLFFDDVMAWGGLAELGSMGVQVPRDRSVVGCDDVLLSAMMAPPLTTVAAPFEEIGRLAVDALAELIDDRGQQPEAMTAAGRFVVRESTGPPN